MKRSESMVCGVMITVLLLLGVSAVWCYESQKPIPPPPVRVCPPVVRLLFQPPFEMSKEHFVTMDKLDRLLSRIEQARLKVPVPRLVLPGPLDAEKVQRLSVEEYLQELRRLTWELHRPHIVTYRSSPRVERVWRESIIYPIPIREDTEPKESKP